MDDVSRIMQFIVPLAMNTVTAGGCTTGERSQHLNLGPQCAGGRFIIPAVELEPRFIDQEPVNRRLDRLNGVEMILFPASA